MCEDEGEEVEVDEPELQIVTESEDLEETEKKKKNNK